MTLIILNGYLTKIDHRDLILILTTGFFEIDLALMMDVLLNLLKRENVVISSSICLICKVASVLRTCCSLI